ncbi:hypothetical protein GCM10023165_52050 [Variovorax defluvii]|uniref:Uncharacterized protein n=1 Tax=Variovorax defluvii TaxID=913761 RepID=A0ABP8IG45_9BURK
MHRAEMTLSPRLPHFVWSANPLTGGAPSGPAKPVPRRMLLPPRLPHFVWSANPLTGGAPCGPAKPVPRVLPNGPASRPAYFMRRGSRDSVVEH